MLNRVPGSAKLESDRAVLAVKKVVERPFITFWNRGAEAVGIALDVALRDDDNSRRETEDLSILGSKNIRSISIFSLGDPSLSVWLFAFECSWIKFLFGRMKGTFVCFLYVQ